MNLIMEDHRCPLFTIFSIAGRKNTMNKNIINAAVLAVAVCSGCGTRSAVPAPASTGTPAASATPQTASGTGSRLPTALPDQPSSLHHVVTTTNGIVYYFPTVAAGQPSYPRQIVTGSYSHLADTVGILEEHDGRLSLEGKPYGRVTKGDHVQITSDKRVIVNGTERLSN